MKLDDILKNEKIKIHLLSFYETPACQGTIRKEWTGKAE